MSYTEASEAQERAATNHDSNAHIRFVLSTKMQRIAAGPLLAYSPSVYGSNASSQGSTLDAKAT